MSAGPRVLLVSHTSEWVGPTNSMWHLLRYWRDRFEPTVLLRGRGAFAEMLEREGVPVESLPSLDRGRIPEIVRLIRRGGFDLIYGNNTGGASRNAFLGSRLARRAFVCHIRSIPPRRQWKKLWFLRHVDAAVAVSEAAAAAHRRYLGRTPTHVVHNGIEPAAPRPDRAAARARVLEAGGFPETSTVVIGVAHVSPRKGQRHAVRALGKLAETHPEARLLLVGALDRDASYVEELRREIDELGLRRRCALAGFRADVEVLLRGSDLFLHPALADPHPRAVLEAMNAGLPVVAFDVDGVSETVRPGETGWLVRPGDVEGLVERLRSLLDDPDGSSRIGRESCRHVATRFHAERTARAAGDVVEGVLRGSGRPALARLRST